jgi:integrase
MPKRALTQLFVDRIGPPKAGRAEYWDTSCRGFGLRVSASGVKSWFVMYRPRGAGKLVRETLGTAAEIKSVSEARRRALASLEAARGGIDPVAEKRARKARAGAEDRDTFAAAARAWVAARTAYGLRPKTIGRYSYCVERDLIPAWGARPIGAISRADVTLLLDDKARASTPKVADEVRRVLQPLFKWALGNKLIEADPTDVSKRTKAVARDRVLSDDEIAAFWAGTDKLGWPFGPIGKLLLLTAQRENEVGGMSWAEIDLDNRTWTIPKERSKNGKAHVVHLSELAVEIIETLPRLGELAFASIPGIVPSGYSKAKLRLDSRMGGAAPWVWHDLRRTATTGMARLGIAPHVADKVLNHTAGTIRGVAAIYNRYAYEEERRAALETWGRFVESLVRPVTSNVVAIVSPR